MGEHQDAAVRKAANDVVYFVVLLGPKRADVATPVYDNDVGGTHHPLYSLPCKLVLIALNLEHGEVGKRIGEEAFLCVDDRLIAQVSVARSCYHDRSSRGGLLFLGKTPEHFSCTHLAR